MFCIIYKITNLLNGKCYVGQTWQPMIKRFAQHKYKNSSVKLHRAIVKYGFNNFTIKCLTVVSTQELADYYETYFISYYLANKPKIGYNIGNGGKGIGKHNRQTKIKISEALKGRIVGPCTNERRNNISKGKMGHAVSAKTRDKLSKIFTGKIISKEWAKNIGLGHLGLTYNIKDPETKSRNLSLAAKKKISDEQVLEILEKWKTNQYTKKQLAIEYKVTVRYINDIISGRKRKLAGK
jgi:group I intron endonuclease